VLLAVIADGAPDAGLGHLARSSAIAEASRSRGLEVRAYAYGALAPSTFDGIEWVPFESPPEADVVVLDTYTMPAGTRAALATAGPLAVVHDEGEIPPGTALVIAMEPAPAAGAVLLGGLRHAPLRSPFWGLPERRVRERVQRVLVTTGGGVLRDAGIVLARDVKRALPAASVALVRAPRARFEPPPGVELVDAPSSLLSELLAADVVVTAAGQTALEAVATGAATIALPLVGNQRANAAALGAAGAALIIEPEVVGAAVASLDRRRREALARAGQHAVDGYGALRIAFRVAALTAVGAADIGS
jgi:spore coat polysaccharide biosynthesis predicted glycosyltransferase SpsG